MRRRRVIALVCALAVVVATIFMPEAGAQTPGADYDLPGGSGHFYTETNGGLGPNFGYRITNEAGIGFWSEFQRLGGVNALGYPASKRFQLDGFIVQATQKVLMQWRPDVSPPQVYFINVFDKLHDMGRDSQLQATFQIPPQLDPSFDAGKTPDQAQAGRLALLNADPAIAGRYGTGPSATLYNGLPTSTVTSMGPFLVLRAQRVAFQHWTVDNPAAGIKAGSVSVVNGGDIAKQLGLVPGSAAIPEDVNGNPAATPTPLATATPTATPVPQYPYLSKSVNAPPTNCGGGNRVPCIDSGPNAGLQYVQGHVMDKNGNGIAGITVRMSFYGNYADTGSEGDGLFTHTLASNCPSENRVYQFYIIDGAGNRSSDIYTVNYSNCNTAGEFHFDFVRQ